MFWFCCTCTGTEICTGCYPHGPLLCNCVGKASKHFMYVLYYSRSMSNVVFLLLGQYISLINPNTSVYCGILRDGYEAFAMYCFGRYITACLGKLYAHRHCFVENTCLRYCNTTPISFMYQSSLPVNQHLVLWSQLSLCFLAKEFLQLSRK